MMVQIQSKQGVLDTATGSKFVKISILTVLAEILYLVRFKDFRTASRPLWNAPLAIRGSLRRMASWQLFQNV